MASFDAHVKQSKTNFSFLEKVNSHSPEVFDWQITVGFYCCVHLVNAHLAQSNLHYRNHEEIKNALNPLNSLSVSRIDESAYLSFEKIHNLSRRSRYLISDDMNNREEILPFNCSDKHLSKTLRNMDTLIHYFSNKYSISDFPKIAIKCDRLKDSNLKYFSIK